MDLAEVIVLIVLIIYFSLWILVVYNELNRDHKPDTAGLIVGWTALLLFFITALGLANCIFGEVFNLFMFCLSFLLFAAVNFAQ